MAQKFENSTGYIISVDVGTTFIRSRVYDHQAIVHGSAQRRVELLYPAPDRVEIDPDQLWNNFVGVIKDAVAASGVDWTQIRALGICSQRATIITWDKETGENFHNFVTWQDKRAANYCHETNDSWSMVALRSSCRLLYSITRKNRYLVGRTLEIIPAMASMRLKWLCSNEPKLKAKLKIDGVMGGDIGTWLLWKLTNGRTYGCELSLASSTGIFDPYILDWASAICTLFGIPYHFLPRFLDTSGKLGVCSKEIFGYEIPITAVAGDQQAAMFGSGCFDVGSVKLALGTGAFVDVNTGREPRTSVDGLHPLVAWKFKDQLVYTAESFSHDAGSTILWGQSIGLFNSAHDTSDIAYSIQNTNGVYFIPAFSGLQEPVNDVYACASFFGLKPSTTKSHMTRAILEAIAFRVYQVFQVAEEDSPFKLTYLRCVGGISENEFICQMIADLCEKPLSTMAQDEIGSLGITFLAGIGAGIWNSVEDVRHLINIKKTYDPSPERREKYLKEYENWRKAVKRSLNWYKECE